MNIPLTALGLAFGQGARNIFLASSVRLGVASIFTIGLSWLFGKSLPHIAFSSSKWATFVIVICVIHLAATITLVLSIGIARAGQSVFERLLVYLPISQLTRMTALLIPECIVAALTTLLASWPLFSWALQQNLGLIFVIIAAFLGILGSLGLLHMLSRKQWILHLFLGIGVLLCEVFLLRYTIFNRSGLPGVSMLLCGLILTPAGLLWRNRHYFIENITYQKTAHISTLHGDSPRLWFIKKVFRTRAQRISFGVTFGLSSVATLALYEHALVDSSLLALLTAILGAAFISDIRALSRRDQPAEITTLTGTIRFVSVELASAFAIGASALLPLIFTLLLATAGPMDSSVWSQVLLGFSVGFFVSTLVVPEGRNISAQCLANLLAIGLLTLPPFFQSPTSVSPFFQCALSVSLLAAAYAIEYHRNPYRWRA